MLSKKGHILVRGKSSTYRDGWVAIAEQSTLLAGEGQYINQFLMLSELGASLQSWMNEGREVVFCGLRSDPF